MNEPLATFTNKQYKIFLGKPTEYIQLDTSITNTLIDNCTHYPNSYFYTKRTQIKHSTMTHCLKYRHQ